MFGEVIFDERSTRGWDDQQNGTARERGPGRKNELVN